MKKSIVNYSSIILLSTLPYLLTKVIRVEKSLTIITLVFLALILFFYSYISKIEDKNLGRVIELLNKLPLLFYFFALFIFIFISQNLYLNIEVITWDVPSYLVSSIDVKNGNLPFETQWESKGPLLTYIYYILSSLSNGVYAYFRVINDFIIFAISLILFFSVYSINKNKVLSGIAALVFSSMVSMRWYVSEYSEFYCLLLISLSYLLYIKNPGVTKIYYIIGFLISLSSLINQATLLFIIPYIILIFNSNKEKAKKLIVISLSVLIPHIFVQIIYQVNDLYNIYIANYLLIPIGYSNDVSESSIYEMTVWFREFFNYNKLLYLSLIGIIFSFIKSIDLKESDLLKKYLFDLYYLNLITSIALYFIGSHNYAHHLIYFIFFLSLLVAKIPFSNFHFVIGLLIFVASSSIFVKSYENSSYNLRNINSVQENYPLYKLSKEIENSFSEEYSIFALDYVMILYYLDKPNYSYIVHPTNHFEDYISEVLIRFNKIEGNKVNKLLKSNPDVIICTLERVHQGKGLKNTEFSCDYDDYKDGYIKLDTEQYRKDRNLEFYWDPYKSLNVFIREK